MNAMKLLPSSTDDACDSKSGQVPFDDATLTLPLDGISATNRYDIHVNRHRKNTVPFLKSNYKYKRRVFSQAYELRGSLRVNDADAVIRPEQTEVKQSRVIFTAGLVAISVAAVVFRDILLSLLRRVVVARERRAWCKNSSIAVYCRLSEMLSEVKGNVLGCGIGGIGEGCRRGRAVVSRCGRLFGLESIGAGAKLIYLTLIIALWMTVYEVEAGSCWTERIDNGKCNALYGNNMTKAQCCGKNQLFSYAEKNMSEVEYFFVLALGGGPECKPCLESCKDVYCGPNKRCVKRKGRPKCICSPKCGSGKKHKKAHKHKHQHQHHHQQHIYQESGSLKPPHVIDISRSKEQVTLVNYHSPITVRDVRSLSSEIYNNPSAVSAMVLTNPEQPIFQLNSRRKNQRISISAADPTKKHATQPELVANQQPKNRLLHQHHYNYQQQQHREQNKVTRRRHAHTNSDRNKGDKLIITADDLIRSSTERDNHLAESNSLRDRSSGTATATADNQHPHQRQQQQHGRHNFKKHAKPKRKIIDQNGAAHNSVYNGTTSKIVNTAVSNPIMTNTSASTTMATANHNEMKMTERSRHRMQSFDMATASPASSFPNQVFNKMNPTLVHPSSSIVTTTTTINNKKNNPDLYPRQDYADYLTFDDKIYNGFFNNGFPYPHQELLIDEGRFAHPVCGTDGRTYNSQCQLKKRACRTDNPALVVAYRGHCQTSCKKVSCLNGLQCVEDHYAIPHCIVCAIECPIDDQTQKIDPARAVCGVDGNTYKSTCDINRMICKIGRSIAVAYPGPCREDRTTCDNAVCGPRMTCLTDLLTHRPRCVSCKFKCSRKRRPTNIRYEEGKLCGTNNRTYNSWCEMKRDSCQTGFFIDIKSIGECQ